MEQHLSRFQGIGGALTVSLIAFTIVFIVLAGLTAVIYAIKLFSGSQNTEKGRKDQDTPAAATPTLAVQAPAAAPSVSDKSRITAVITAAVLAATQGRGRVMSITPAAGRTTPFTGTNWRTSGIVERVGSRLIRPWKH
ncbi:MAG: OadG family protein [Synergistaceae bacterium]|jgi:sodium pump decarboxylase gamma subunit|nr:OadG family protein [Synergistaceae bacterium]